LPLKKIYKRIYCELLIRLLLYHYFVLSHRVSLGMPPCNF
jgi:hypothetical protein